MLVSPYATLSDRIRIAAVIAFCALVLAFLVLPIFVPVPLSVNSEAFFTYPLKGFSWRWYRDVLGSGQWRDAIWHSIVIAIGVTVVATVLGTLAAVGLSSPSMPARRSVMAILISPLIVPVIITAVGAYLFYAPIGLANSFLGIIVAQTTVASPFVVVTVGASLANFDRTLMRAAAISGARPMMAFQRVMLPSILPGVLSGAAFAFVASFDELVIALFLAGPQQRTLPMQMFVGLREHLDPT
ncbi:MAG TPA: ABC transporter permease, partial [Acetobacteraceae bacterium]|nr:ABC transporter permease [Acetobacteraceae bacterium]